MTTPAKALALLLATTTLAPMARAEVTRLDILTHNAPALAGRTFATGTAEKFTGRATIALDPSDPANAVIKDIDRAPRNTQGRVEATTDVTILRPAHPNGTLLFEVVNRGRKLLPGWTGDTDPTASSRLEQASDAGTGFLLDQGFTLVWAGWQADTPASAGLRIDVPTIPGITGPSREEFTLDAATGPTPAPRRVTLAYPAADPANATLAMRTSADAPKQAPADLGYVFIDPQTIAITPPKDAPAGALYDFAYTARDPRVMGMGLAAIRDVASFLRRDASPANPIAGTIHHAIALGISQSGRVLRDALYDGMNQDEAGRLVFEGMMPIIPGARRAFINARWAQPGRNPGPQFDRLYPVLQFPFTYPVTDDLISGRRDGILLRCSLSNTCPNVIQADSEFEFWGSQASLVTTDTAGNPIDMPPNVRLFMFAGTPHGNLWNAVATTRPDCALPLNPNNAGPSLRALIVAMNRWITEGAAPPASRYPSRAQGTLVPPDRAYPAAPALKYRAQYARAQWIEQTPTGPTARADYPLFVPRPGPDGNAVAGIRLPIVAAPRATYTGWNPVAGLDGPQDLCTQMGAVIPLPAHAAADDPRPALDTLYPTPDSYVAAVRAAAEELVHARLLLPTDAEAAIAAARAGTLAKLGALAP